MVLRDALTFCCDGRRRSAGVFIAVIVAVTVFVYSGCGNGEVDANRTIVLIGTGDLQGRMEPFVQNFEINGSNKQMIGGGIARIASVLKKAKADYPARTVVVSTGDDLMGRYFHTFRGKAIYTLMRESGYGLYAPGNHEFDKGPDVFAKALDGTGFSVLCSDLSVAGTPLEGKCLPFKIIEAEGVKIGFFSLMTEELPLIASPGSVKLNAPNMASAAASVSALKAAGCDIVIALTHIGFDQDKAVAEKVKGIDVIFGGHSHRYIRQLTRVGDTLIVNGGEEGSNVVKLVLPLDKTHRIRKAKTVYELIPLIDTIALDPEVNATLKTYKDQLPATIVLGKTTVEWNLTTPALREGESNVADLVNNLLKTKTGVQIVMNNAGAFRGKKVYPPGDITDTMLHEIDAFSNNAYMLKLEGRYIRQALERSAALYGEGGLMQVSGLHYTIDLSKQMQVFHCNGDGNCTVEIPGKRVVRAEVVNADGTISPLKDERVYTLLSNAYTVEHAGDGYFWFREYGTSPKNTFMTFYTMMAAAAQNQKVLNPPAPDGRLKVLKP